MEMGPLVIMILIATLLKSCSAEMSALEKFLSSGFNKEKTETTDTAQAAGNTAATTHDLIKFLRRAGLVATDNQINNRQRILNTLQALNSQQQSGMYLPQQSVNPQQQSSIYLPQQSVNTQQQSSIYLPQQSVLTSYATPSRQLDASQQQKQQSTLQSSSSLVADTSSKTKSAADQESQQDTASKSVVKENRQGLYSQDGTLYDSGHQDGYSNAHDGYSSHHDSYPTAYHAPEPVYHKDIYVKKPPVAIKIDPIGILKLLLSGIPKPLLNLNGKLFFGVELGKHAGIVKGVGHYPPPHHPHGGKNVVLTLG